MSNIYAKVVTEGRLRPAVTQDTEFFWNGAKAHRLLLQRCVACGALRHPPGPACPSCHSLKWDSIEASGLGRLYSYVVSHHPPVPGFQGPFVVGLIELAEGPRMVSNVVGIDPRDLIIGEELTVFFVDQKEGWTAPQFRRPP